MGKKPHGGSHAHGPHPRGEHAHEHHFRDPAAWVERFEAPERVTWQKPAEVMGSLSVQRGARVVDLGAGTGYFTIPLARAVGPSGVVYAVDAEPAMVEHVQRRAEREGAPAVVGIVAAPDDPRIPEPVDLIVSVDTYHHLADRAAYLRKLRAALRPNGRVAIIDWRKADLPLGPPAEMKLEEGQILAEMVAAGFAPAERFDYLPYQCFLVFGVQSG